MVSEPVAATLLVIEVLEKLGVPYFIAGSLAASVHGIARSTIDSDLVAELGLEHADALHAALADRFYVDSKAIRRAIVEQRSFNLIHLETMFKVDVFVSRRRPFDRTQFLRRQRFVVALDPERQADVATAEDTILSKLEWYRDGGETSDRQWRDVLGIMKVQAERLDWGYMREWAGAIQTADLLERARAEAGLM